MRTILVILTPKSTLILNAREKQLKIVSNNEKRGLGNFDAQKTDWS